MDRKRERALIQGAKAGDKRAFAALYRAYVDKIYRYVFYRVSAPEIAEDITSEVFLRMVESLPTYEDRSIPLLVWLYRIAHARVIDHYRRTQRHGQAEDIDKVEIGVDPDLDSPLLAAYQSEQVQKAIHTLTDGQKQVIILRFIEGYNLENTARIMNKTIDAVKAMQYRALQAIAQALKEQGYQNEE